MFESLSQRLNGAIKRLSGQGRINEVNIAESMRDIRRALLEADVNYQVARDFTNRVKEKVLGDVVLQSIAPGQQIVKIVLDEIIHLLGGDASEINLASDPPPAVILIAGLQGSGKTTFSAKLALHLQSQGRVPVLAAADVYRPAAVDQLKKLGQEINVPVFSITSEDGSVVQDAPRVAKEAITYARKQARDTVIIDTAGRLHVDERMMAEVAEIKQIVQPSEILFVVDSMTGQDAVNTAQEFHSKLNFDGVVLTKLDGDTRGGAALSIRSVVSKPIKFASTGEKIDQLTLFHPDRIARRILGMGDVVTLVEKAQQEFDDEQSEAYLRKIQKESFDLEDFLDQMQKIKTMGSMTDLLGMIPGMSNQLRAQASPDESFIKAETLILSMTPWERKNPDRLNGQRKRRIAAGSGHQVRDLNELLTNFKKMRKMLKGFQSKMSQGKQVDLSALLRNMR
ncbi:MAG: signal recognition particle protein [Bacteroidetes bacterium]|nr:signal recognition particle protein [Bacteroidota bacterium]MCY4233839.1 signal recognition particle protein [Bacteroidota bacterium]